MPRSQASPSTLTGAENGNGISSHAREGVRCEAPESEAFQCLDIKCLDKDTAVVLTYRLVVGPVDLAPLQIRQSRSFCWRGGPVVAHVLGASHAVSLTFPDGYRVTELLTCLPPAVVGTATLACVPFAVTGSDAQSDTDATLAGRLTAHVHLSRFPLSSTDALKAQFARADSLHEPFHDAAGGDTAWTRIGWRMERDRLWIETVHTYPEAGCGIRSETVFHRLSDIRSPEETQ